MSRNNRAALYATFCTAWFVVWSFIRFFFPTTTETLNAILSLIGVLGVFWVVSWFICRCIIALTNPGPGD